MKYTSDISNRLSKINISDVSYSVSDISNSLITSDISNRLITSDISNILITRYSSNGLITSNISYSQLQVISVTA